MTAPAHAPIARRVAGFIDHLRLNDFAVGPAETQAALTLIDRIGPLQAAQVRNGLKILLTGRHEEWARFDDLFEAYWFARGRERTAAGAGSPHQRAAATKPTIWSDHLPDSAASGLGDARGGGDTEQDAAGEAAGRIVASRQTAVRKADLRHVADRDEIAEAERLAYRLAAAMRYRLSRRFSVAAKGPKLDLRRTIRANIGHGGEPITLVRRARPDRPVRIVVLLDVSGSMKLYSRFFLQFVKGLVCEWIDADAYLFHTRLIRVTDALKDKDTVKAMTRLALMAEGFGGGTRLGECLKVFNDRYAKRALNSRTVFMVLSDGYDTGTPETLVAELTRLKKRVRRIVWLNPMLGWRDYEPITRAMAAALPLIDHFAAANTLESLAGIEDDLGRL
ncbi:vWA domain-containing protein [Microbaculum marinisediminis]|uniref:VWA domain-containing protein n=1 Tax=Microbaculum marinisediminis TaxID=2931392 RepID=A0AAW5R6Z7_9HYPH|nr:VWA domain-containing protein [Microbaculum sp. A6E488]MCT8974693.1 VWA domain-containing protein [Microbaculum sp. A6E488]